MANGELHLQVNPMVVKPASRWKNLPGPSPHGQALTQAKAEAKNKGIELISFDEGDPVIFDHLNRELNQHLIDAINDGWYMYPYEILSDWRPELRRNIATFEEKHRGAKYVPEDIILGPGVAGCFNTLHYALLDAGDEVVVVSPAHYSTGPSSYWHQFDAKSVTSNAFEEEGWAPDIDDLRAKITNKTKAITVVNPNNPTGAIYDKKALKQIIDVAGEHDLVMISDEIYGMITFDGIEATPTASVAGDVPVLALGGVSKFFMRTGWRLGYICFHDPEGRMSELQSVMTKVAGLYGHMTESIPLPIIVACAKTFQGTIDSGQQFTKVMETRRDLTMKRISEINGITCVSPKGALYSFPRVDSIGTKWKTDREFILHLMRDEGVDAIPGSNYGPAGEGHFRTLLLPSEKTLNEAFDRLARFMNKHQ